MNIIFVTQGMGCRFHFQLMKQIAVPLDIGKAGFYVTDSMFFRRFEKENPEFSEGHHAVLKEWEILEQALKEAPDLEYLRRVERESDVKPLWDALVCDRRVVMGRLCRERQEYRP